MDDWRIQLFTTQREALITEREAMLAANTERTQRDESLAYGADAFMELATRFTEIEEEIRNWAE